MFFYTLPNDAYTRLLTMCEFGAPEPHFDADLFGPDPLLKLIQAEHIWFDRKILVLVKETGSWCFFDADEYHWFRSLDGIRLREMLSRCAPQLSESLTDVVARLYWLGLLKINEREFFDRNVLSVSAVQQDHLLASLAITYRCNLKCAYCYADAGPSRRERLEWDRAKRILDLILQEPFNSVTIELTGGEPLLEVDLIEQIVRYASVQAERFGKDVDFCAQTNGTLLNGEILKRVESLGLAVGTSLDGTASINDRTRVFSSERGAFESVARNLAKLSQTGFPVGVLCVISRTNYHCISQELRKLWEMGIRGIKFNPIYFLGRARGHWENLAITADEFLHTHRSYIDGLLRADYATGEENTVHMLNLLGSKIHRYRCMRSQCGAGRTFFAFSPTGDVYPCGRFKTMEELRLGNTRDIERLGDLWTRNPVMSRLTERNISTIPMCKECRYGRFCQGGCSLDSYFRFGKTGAVSTLCAYYLGIYQELFGRLAESPRILEILGIEAEVYDKPVPGVTERG